MRLLRSIYGQVLLGIALGIAVGVAAPDFAVGCKILGDMFITLIKMIVAPVIVCTVVVGIAHVGDMVATLVIARWEGKIDLAHARAVLDGRITPNLDLLDDADVVPDAIPAREPAAAFRRPLSATVPAT
jgi:Na+/H+-dicarboxylate symporter